ARPTWHGVLLRATPFSFRCSTIRWSVSPVSLAAPTLLGTASNGIGLPRRERNVPRGHNALGRGPLRRSAGGHSLLRGPTAWREVVKWSADRPPLNRASSLPSRS